MNNIKLTGRLTDDPKIGQTGTGITYANFTIAVDRPHTKKEDKLTDFFSCTVWGRQDGPGRAATIQNYFHKGDGIIIDGVMQSRKYKDKDTGKNLTAWGVRVDDFEFPMGKRNDTAPQPTVQAPTPDTTFTEVTDEGLPF